MLKKTVNVSCVIPVLNEEQYLPILLNSIVHQDVAPREIIVADAGSRDRTVEIAKSFGCKIVPGGSVPKGRNSGGFSAIGDYILFLDADVKVYYLPEVILERDKERRVLRSQSATQAMNDAVVAKKRPGPSGGVSSLAHCGVASRLCATVGTLLSSRLTLTSNLETPNGKPYSFTTPSPYINNKFNTFDNYNFADCRRISFSELWRV